MVRPNTVLVGASTDDRYEEHARLLEIVHRQRRNLVLFREGYTFVGHRDNLGFDLAAPSWGSAAPRSPASTWCRHADNAGLMLSRRAPVREPLFRPNQLVLKTIVFDELTRRRAERPRVATSGRITADMEVVVATKQTRSAPSTGLLERRHRLPRHARAPRGRDHRGMDQLLRQDDGAHRGAAPHGPRAGSRVRGVRPDLRPRRRGWKSTGVRRRAHGAAPDPGPTRVDAIDDLMGRRRRRRR